MSHSPEPWKVELYPATNDPKEDPGYSLEDANGAWVLDVVDVMYESCSPEITKVDLERIVACVNFLATIPTEVLNSVLEDHKKHPRGALLDMRNYIVAWVRCNFNIFGISSETLQQLIESQTPKSPHSTEKEVKDERCRKSD